MTSSLDISFMFEQKWLNSFGEFNRYRVLFCGLEDGTSLSLCGATRFIIHILHSWYTTRYITRYTFLVGTSLSLCGVPKERHCLFMVYQMNVTVYLWCVREERHCLFMVCTKGTSLSLCDVYKRNVTVSLWCVPK